MACPHCEIGRYEREVIDAWDYFFAHGVELTKQQTRVVAALLGRGGVVTMEALVGAVWYDCPNGEPDYADSIIKVHISKIRKKIAIVDMPFKIRSVWGLGYAADKNPGKAIKSIGVSLILTLLCIYPLSSFAS